MVWERAVLLECVSVTFGNLYASLPHDTPDSGLLPFSSTKPPTSKPRPLAAENQAQISNISQVEVRSLPHSPGFLDMSAKHQPHEADAAVNTDPPTNERLHVAGTVGYCCGAQADGSLSSATDSTCCALSCLFQSFRTGCVKISNQWISIAFGFGSLTFSQSRYFRRSVLSFRCTRKGHVAKMTVVGFQQSSSLTMCTRNASSVSCEHRTIVARISTLYAKRREVSDGG